MCVFVYVFCEKVVDAQEERKKERKKIRHLVSRGRVCKQIPTLRASVGERAGGRRYFRMVFRKQSEVH